MPVSLPSSRFANVDVPEVQDFTSDFVYNFFMADEKINDSGFYSQKYNNDLPGDTFDQKIVDSINFKRTIPRYIKLTWKPHGSIGINSLQNLPKIKNFLNKIQDEDTFTSEQFSTIFFQDNGRDQKLKFIIERALETYKNNNSNNASVSPLDIIRNVNAITDENVRPRFLSDAFVSMRDGVNTYVDNNHTVYLDTTLEEISSVRVKAQINNKFLANVLRTTAQNSVNIFNDELEAQIKVAQEIQNRAQTSGNSTIMSGGDYDFEILDYIDVKEINPKTFNSKAYPVGYIINKFEVDTNGQQIEKEPIVVENPASSLVIDFKVKYDTAYAYTIKTISVIEIAVQDLESNNFVAISFLVASKPSSRSVIVAEETVPPPPPADFNVAYDYHKKALRLMWSFPVNAQRDIKKFQIFRRTDIGQPFELIKQYDFDDSLIRSAPREFPDVNLVEELTSPKNYYLDLEFTKESKFIYAVCSIDAHNLSSGYSTQFEVSFNRFENKLTKNIISLSGAPKAYPNAYLKRDTFVDTIRDSGHRKLKIIFNPEVLTVVNNNGDDLGLLKTGNEDKYQIQMINIDLQEQQVVDIKLVDRRTTTEKDEEDL